MPAEIMDFDTFYAERIEPSMPQLKKAQVTSRGWKAGMVGSLAIVGLYVVGFIANPSDANGWIIFFLVAVVLLCFYQYVRSNDNFSDHHKTLVIQEVVNYVAPGAIYKPYKRVSSRAFKESRLYQYDYSSYEGSDYIEGQINGIRFQCSELVVSCTDPDGRGFVNVFKGLFFVAAIGGHIGGGTFIWPRKEHQDAEHLNVYYELLPIKGTQKIATGDPGFDKYFRLRSSAPAEAAMLLTAERRKSMLQICQATQLPLSFSFVAGRCYVGIPLNKDLLEVSRADAGDKNDIKEHYVSISLISGLVRQLALAELL